MYMQFTSWTLLVAIPISSAMFCFWSTTYDNIIASMIFTISLIPLMAIHLSRFGLLRVRHGISNAMMSLNLGTISWQQYLNKFEIVLQEEYHILKPGSLTKPVASICALFIAISISIILLFSPLSYIWISSGCIGVTALFTAIMIWHKTECFNYTHYNRSDTGIYGGTLREMHQTAITLLVQFFS